jgi:signal transduction histidine kinase/DNA-binding LacI/PurR family transcriptional regulator
MTDNGPYARGETARPTVGMLTTSLLNLFQRQWLGVLAGAQACGVNLIAIPGRELASPDGFKAQANVVYDLVSAERLDGLVVWTTPLQLYVGQERVEEFCRRFEPLPMVSIEQALGEAPCVLLDNRGGMRAAVDHLIEAHGHRRIAFVRGPDTHPGAQDRYAGYLDSLAAHGLTADPALVTAAPLTWEPADAAAMIHRVLDEAPGVDAVVAANDDLALGVLAALRDRAVHVPRDIAVVGFDDAMSIVPHDLGLESADLGGVGLTRTVNVSAATLPLTTVRAPFDLLGRQAVVTLLARIRGEAVADVEVLGTELVVRRSCGCISAAAQEGPWRGPRVSRPPASTSFRRTIAARRDQIVAELQRAFPAHSVSTPDWAERLLTTFVAAFEGTSADPFLEALDELVRESMRGGERLQSWWPVLFALRAQTTPFLTTDGARARAENLWLRVQAYMGEMADRFWSYRQLVGAKRDQIVREIGQSVITALDVDEIADALVRELPRVGIPSCCVATYVHADDAPAEHYPTESARAVLVYEDHARVEPAAGGDVFPSRSLMPGDRLLTGAEPFTMVLLPLHFKEQQLGFAVFEAGPRIGWIYEALAEQLSSALQGTRLVERERRALAAFEEGRRRLEAAHDELEERVAERTTELARANEVLTEQILERERAEEMQKRLEGQLRQAQKMEAIGRLAGGIAHDINNVLLVINGYTDLMLRAASADDLRRLDLEQIQRAGERAANLTRQLLAFSRQQVLQPTVLNLNDVLANVDAMLQRLIGDEIALVARPAPSLPPIRADVGQLEQILLNLAVNARDAMPGGGHLTIETANVELDEGYARERIGVEAGPHVLLRVSDTGTGMDADTQARLFEPFFTTKPPGEGTGLGLATVFGIVQQSGGHIAVASELDAGTTFEIYLPVVREAVEAATPEPAPADASPHGSETILLVEDDPGVRGAIRRFLKLHGYQVLQAGDGREALRLCEQHDGPVHLVVADVMMPGMRGPELVDRLARIRPETPVLYVSGYTDSTSIQETLSAPTVSLLQKPFTAEALARKVRELLDVQS